ncbi:MAG: hypothetical protein DBY09_07220 [Selenomonadales bacterium]|nr:MAG: hypothetical protein DBY09_07220 [Selenomonadales bacterium]DAJ36543.1 MAG TPA: hypothetical protein [Inoviridae sp.]
MSTEFSGPEDKIFRLREHIKGAGRRLRPVPGRWGRAPRQASACQTPPRPLYMLPEAFKSLES